MVTPAEIIDQAASLMNDTAQTVFTDTACLPYLNIALDELQELYEQNNVPTTNDVSVAIAVPAGTTEIGFGIVPALPDDLIEIRQLWESESGQDNWIPMTKKEYIPQYLLEQNVSGFLVWAWRGQKIHVPAAIQDNDLKIDYIRSIFQTPLLIANINVPLPDKNIKSFLAYRTASLCSMFIGENPTRADVLGAGAQDAWGRLLNIHNKGKQSITVRHRPFRASYKSRVSW
jgi:hypothetical protein